MMNKLRKEHVLDGFKCNWFGGEVFCVCYKHIKNAPDIICHCHDNTLWSMRTQFFTDLIGTHPEHVINLFMFEHIGRNMSFVICTHWVTLGTHFCVVVMFSTFCIEHYTLSHPETSLSAPKTQHLCVNLGVPFWTCEKTHSLRARWQASLSGIRADVTVVLGWDRV